MLSRVRRRAVLRIGAFGALAAALGVRPDWLLRPASAAPAAFEVRELEVAGKHASRATLLVPTNLRKEQRVRLLVALHGLGESHDPALGIRAWLDRYGLRAAYPRLLTPPVLRTSKRGEWSDERLREVNLSLKASPFAGLAVLCPFTPNLNSSANRPVAARQYADWLVEKLLPVARRDVPLIEEPAATSIDGCSMGGPLAIEVFAAHPQSFGALGLVQAAFGAHRAASLATTIAEAAAGRALPVQLLTSSGDPFRDSHRALATELDKRGIASALRVPTGPHDQPFLREAGCIEMLLFHERGRDAPRP